MSPRLPETVRNRAIRAGRAAKAAAMAKRGATSEDGHKAYRSAWNSVNANWRYAMDPGFRRRSLEASARYRESQ